MTTLIEAMKQALEALESFREISDFTPAQAVHAITTLRTAIEQAEKQEPVAWGFKNTRIGEKTRWMMLRGEVPEDDQYGGALWTPLYTTPPAAQRQPLTDEQIRDLWSWSATTEAERTANTQQHAFARAIEAAHGTGEQK